MKNFRISFFSIAIILITICFLSCASNPYAAGKRAYVPEDFFGITPDRSPLNEEDYILLDEFNTSWIRTTIRWSHVEPERGKWNFERYDNYLEKAEAAGKKVIWILAFDNKWLFKNNKEKRKITNKELPYYLNYIETVVKRYGTRVVYEIWNEPNVIFWKGTNKQFYSLAAAAVLKVRETLPEATILAGSTFRVPRGFSRGLFKAGVMEHTDGFSVHPYAFTPRKTIRQYNQLVKIFDEFNYDKPAWVTEVGYFTGPRPFFSTKHFPEYIVKTLSSLSARSGDIRNSIWYELMNNENKGEGNLNPLTYMGLMYPDKTLKPGAESYMLTAGYLAGSEYNPDLPLREGIRKKVTSLYFLKDSGESILILWKDGAGNEKICLSVPNAVNMKQHDIMSREITLLQGNIDLEVGKLPIFITWNNGSMPVLKEIDK